MPRHAELNEDMFDDLINEGLTQSGIYVYLFYSITSKNLIGLYRTRLDRDRITAGADEKSWQQGIREVTKKRKIVFKEGFVWIVGKAKKIKGKDQERAAQKILREYPDNLDIKHEFLERYPCLNPAKPSSYDTPPLTRRQLIAIRDGFKCRYCGTLIESQKDLEVDHVIPLSRGGKDVYENQVCSCRTCNQKKLDSTAKEFGFDNVAGTLFHSNKGRELLRKSANTRNMFRTCFGNVRNVTYNADNQPLTTGSNEISHSPLPIPKPIPKERDKTLSSDFLKRAEKLKILILQNNPSAKVKESGWGDIVRLMVERDKRTLAAIDQVIEWSQGDDFEKTNVLSMGKLRERFDSLTMKMKRGERGRESGICPDCKKPMAKDGKLDAPVWFCTDCKRRYKRAE